MSAPLENHELVGKRVLVTGSSRGIGAQVIQYVAAAGAKVAINYRNKEARAGKIAQEITDAGGEAIVIGADLTDPVAVLGMMGTLRDTFNGLDILVLNASGGMEPDVAEDYAMKLNRDAQVGLLNAALPLLAPGGRVVFITSHQAHFIRDVDTMPEYRPVALSKRAGEDALRAMKDELEAKEVGFVVVSGDMIEGTVTATLLNRMHPGALDERKEVAGKIYNVEEFAAEVTRAIVDDIPDDHTRLVGDTSSFSPSN
ncbi:SDR family oxidoreductase [Pontimonas sp.]|jgi:NAD(P)-dependent dehydrogenase (short-subunit alcohol dehydrogenase family)|uniref:SDR family oxidoreductase n=1 Tax=Pontimonas sp. TaxID=2304492 RepID=UPI0028708A9A|nr:SDR family oxidoreductase [Pontimonas sp.]MDR9396661.1 SDR family oxidoreductase [Pontimonas sp.]MDR9433918.1 SDR family oxidoreductase [Pontimonas sp.]